MYLYICDWKLRGISLTVYVTQTISDYIRGSGRSFLPIRYCCRRYLLDQRNMLPPETRKIWRGFDWWVLMFWNELSIPAFMTACAYRTWRGGPDIALARVPTRDIWERDTVFSGECCHLTCNLIRKYFCETFDYDYLLFQFPYDNVWQGLNTIDCFIRQVL